MSILTQKLQEARKLFHSHSFSQSLAAYEECLRFCKQTDDSQSMVSNILSAKATLEYILGDYDKALSSISSVLSKDPHHFLSLMRRSQIYKKKNKLKKALRDLQKIQLFSPDNIQISALKAEIQHMLMKKQKDIQSSSSEQEVQDDEEAKLNFIQLKLIDRKSSILSNKKERKSRVTILGDTTIQYKREDEVVGTNKDEQDLESKAIKTYHEIEIDDETADEEAPIIRIKTKPRQGGSILKNKGTSIFIREDDTQERKSRYLGKQSKILTLLKNIDGKIIPSAQHQRELDHSLKEVQFRKSISLKADTPNTSNKSILSKQSSCQKRKSILKRPSFQASQKNQTLRKSKFESIDLMKIDGHIISHEEDGRSIDQSPDPNKEHSDSDNDNSEHNIFGSKKVMLSPAIKKSLGLENLQQSHQFPKSKLKAKKSILKKNSSMLMSSPLKRVSTLEKEAEDLAKSNTSVKSKKSVIFNCTL